MSVSSFIRFSGLCLVITGVAFVLFAILYTSSATKHLAAYVNIIGMLFLLLGLVGMFLRQMHVFGKFGFLTFLFYFLGAGMWTGFGWVDAFVVPVLEDQAPKLVDDTFPGLIGVGLMISLISFFLGMILFNLVSAVKAIFPRWVAIILVIVPFIDFIPIGNYLAQPIAGLAYIWIGYLLWKGKLGEWDVPAKLI